MTKPNEYQCANCGGIFDSVWSEEEALAEKSANGFDGMDCVVVCDDCYRAIMLAHGSGGRDER